MNIPFQPCTRRRALHLAALAAALTASLSTAAAWAQKPTDESAPAFDSFNKWVGTTVTTEAVPARTQAVEPAAKGGQAAVRFEPLPVILGAPDLPLMGIGTREANANWAGTLNYQGLYASYVLIDATGKQQAVVPLSTKVKTGQRFRIRLTSTFNGVAVVDQVLGTAFDAQRTGQVYPETGSSVELKAGQSTLLPVQPNQHFVVKGRSATERLVLQVRHAMANTQTRSDQPAYRQENKTGSSYLQLMPKGRYPTIEQVLVMAR